MCSLDQSGSTEDAAGQPSRQAHAGAEHANNQRVAALDQLDAAPMQMPSDLSRTASSCVGVDAATTAEVLSAIWRGGSYVRMAVRRAGTVARTGISAIGAVDGILRINIINDCLS